MLLLADVVTVVSEPSTADHVWSWVLKIGAPLIGTGVLALLGWVLTLVGSNTKFQKALSQLISLVKGLASDITSGMAQSINDATADGVVTAEERAQLVAQLVGILKNSAATRLLDTVRSGLGLVAGPAFEMWLRGVAGDAIDAQLTAASPLPPQQKSPLGPK